MLTIKECFPHYPVAEHGSTDQSIRTESFYEELYI